MTLITVDTKRCSICNKKGTLQVEESEYQAWRDGAHVQNAMPKMKPELREQLISGIHPECWNQLFGDGYGDPDNPEALPLGEAVPVGIPTLVESLEVIYAIVDGAQVTIRENAERVGTKEAWEAYHEIQTVVRYLYSTIHKLKVAL